MQAHSDEMQALQEKIVILHQNWTTHRSKQNFQPEHIEQVVESHPDISNKPTQDTGWPT